MIFEKKKNETFFFLFFFSSLLLTNIKHVQLPVIIYIHFASRKATFS